MDFYRKLLLVVSALIFAYTNFVLSGLIPYYGGLSELYCFSFFFFNSYNHQFFFGVDGISFCFIWLTSLVMFLCIFLEFRNPIFFKVYYSSNLKPKTILIILLLIETLLIFCFTSLDIFIFLMSFESLLLPMFFLIGIFGTQSNGRQIRAAYFFFLYSFIFSLFSIFLIIYLYLVANTTNILLLSNCIFLRKQQIILAFCLLMTFCAKIPMLPFHIWLPQAHVEAPTVGSIILACLLLKLGGYGFIRFLIPLFTEGVYFFLPIVNSLALLSIIYSSFAAMYQVDLKKIIAYSSISHMNLATLGLFSLNEFSVNGAIFIMISHGIASMALFLLAGILYEQWKTRCILYLGGLCQVQPLLFIYNFIFFMVNSSVPGTSNFIGEFLILLGFFSLNFFTCLLIMVGSALSLVYSLRSLNFIFFGSLPKYNFVNFNLSDISYKEKLCLDILLLIVLLLGVRPCLVFNIIQSCVKDLLLYY